MPELARHALLSTPQRLVIRPVWVIEFFPQPPPRSVKDTASMRSQFLARQQIAAPSAVVAHTDWDVDRYPVEWSGQRTGNVAAEPDLTKIAVKEHGDPALAETVEAERPHPRFNSLKKSLPLSSMMMNAGKSTTSIRQIASMPSSGYSTTSTFLMQCSARFAAAPPIEPR